MSPDQNIEDILPVDPAPVTPAPKSFACSKVVYFNIFVTIAALLSLLAASDVVSADVSKILLIVVAAVNIVLRVWFTSEPILAKV